MSTKRLIIILTVFASLATVLVGLAAGSGGKSDRRQQPQQQKGAGTPSGPTTSSPRQNPDATMKYWTPDRMKRAHPLPIGIPGAGPQPDGPGGSGSTAPSHR
jgi:hypothetical protein